MRESVELAVGSDVEETTRCVVRTRAECVAIGEESAETRGLEDDAYVRAADLCK